MDTRLKKLLTSLFIGMTLLTSCNTSDEDENITQVFKLVSVQFTPSDEPFEEILSEPETIVFENRSDTTKTFSLTRKDYQKKTSFFYTPENPLLTYDHIQGQLTSVPEIDAEPKIIGLSTLKYPVIFNKQQVQTDTIGSSTATINVSAKSAATITSQWIGYKIKATYQLTLKEEISGELIILTGKWEGTQEVSKDTKLEEDTNRYND